MITVIIKQLNWPTVLQCSLWSSTCYTICPDWSWSWSKISITHSIYRFSTVQLSTHHCSISQIPAKITHCSHWPLWRTSTLPAQRLSPPTNLTFTLSVYWIQKTREVVLMNKSKSQRIWHKILVKYKTSAQTCTNQSNITVMWTVVFVWQRCWTEVNLRFISSALNLLCPHLSVSFVKSSCSQHLYRSPTVQLSTHNLCILLVKDSITHWHPRLIMKDL